MNIYTRASRSNNNNIIINNMEFVVFNSPHLHSVFHNSYEYYCVCFYWKNKYYKIYKE